MTLHRYLFSYANLYVSRHFIVWLMLCVLGLTVIIGFFEGIETLRRCMNRPDVPLSFVLELTLLRLPQHVIELLPFIVFLASLLSLWRLSLGSEIIALRAAGISGGQLAFGMATTAFTIGTIALFVLNPLSAALNARYSALEESVLKRNHHRMAIASTGFWLKEVVENKKVIFHAGEFNVKDRFFKDVTFYDYDKKDQFVKRVDAKEAELVEAKWILKNVIEWHDGKIKASHDVLDRPTTLTFDKIQKNTIRPEQMPFWRIPSFIRHLKNNGLSTVLYDVYFQRLWAEVALLSVMAVLAVGFCLPSPRFHATSRLIIMALLSGFAIHFLNNIVQALGLAGRLTPFLAAWIPPLVTGLFGVSYLLHAEEKA
jgi:lipopolysaccharide export system permease protein